MDLEISYAYSYTRKEKIVQHLQSFLLYLAVSGFDYMRFFDRTGKEITPLPFRGKMPLPFLALLPPGVTLDFSTNEQRENWAILLTLPGVEVNNEHPFEYTFEQIPMRAFLQLSPGELHTLKETFSGIAHCFSSGHAPAKVKAELLTQSLFAHLIASPEEDAFVNTPEGALKKAIDQDVHFVYSLRELQEKLALGSLPYMRKLFLARYGVLPCNYRNNLRMNRILELFAKTDLSLKMIADEVGMKHLEHLYAFLRQRQNLSPKELMDQFRSRKK